MLSPSLLTSTFTYAILDPVYNTAIKTLLYFDIFHHPLTVDEIHNYLQDTKATRKQVEVSLHQLTKEGIIKNSEGYYHLSSTSDAIIRRRLNGEKNAAKSWKIAKRFSRFISK